MERREMNETLNWKQAAIAWGEGKALEFKTPLSDWEDFQDWNSTFHAGDKYRLKPVVSPVTEEKHRFIYDENYSIYYDQINCTGEIKSFGIGNPACEVMNRLHDENEALKAKIKHLTREVCDVREAYMRDLAQVKEERDVAIRTHLDLEDELESLSKDKQTTPVRDAYFHPLQPQVEILKIRLEKVEKDFAFFIKNQQMANNPYFKS